MRTITFVTTNDLKLQYARAAFEPYDLELEASDHDTVEIQANRCEAVAREEARRAAAELDRPVIVADNGLFISALDGFPGPYTRYIGDTIGIKGIMTLLKGRSDRSARLEYVVAYADPSGEEKTFKTVTTGRIAGETRGKEGILIDYLFIPDDERRTLSEIAADDFEQYRTYWDRSTPQFAAWYTEQDG